MVTSIQISESLREDLLKFKGNSKESYEDVIRKLLDESQFRKKKEEELMIEGYKQMAQMSLDMVKEFEQCDLEDLRKIEY